MKTKILTAVCLVFGIGMLSAQSVMGAFQINTTPVGADVYLYDTDQYLSSTPSPVYPVLLDAYASSESGILGREIELIITKDGYLPKKETIFVPLVFMDERSALNNPIVYNFMLDRDVLVSYLIHLRLQRSYTSVYQQPTYVQNNYYYSSPRPWYPPANYYYNYNPRPRPGGGHGSGHSSGNSGNYPPNYPGGGNPPNPPGGGNNSGGHSGGGSSGSHGGGGGYNPPNPPGGGNSGSGGGGHGGGYTPPNPPGGGSGGGGQGGSGGSGGSSGGGNSGGSGGSGNIPPNAPQLQTDPKPPVPEETPINNTNTKERQKEIKNSKK